jgi:hypothetical protein
VDKLPARSDFTADEDAEAGAQFTVPEYRVGSTRLRVYWNGLLCFPGEDGQYMEIGAEDAASTAITWNDALESGSRLDFVTV